MPEIRLEPRFLIFGLLAILVVIALFRSLPVLMSADDVQGGADLPAAESSADVAEQVVNQEPATAPEPAGAPEATRPKPPEIKVEGDLVGRVISAEEAEEAEQG